MTVRDRCIILFVVLLFCAPMLACVIGPMALSLVLVPVPLFGATAPGR